MSVFPSAKALWSGFGLPVVYEGDDPAAYALATNLLRRDLSQGAKAMIGAKARLFLGKNQEGAAMVAGGEPRGDRQG